MSNVQNVDVEFIVKLKKSIYEKTQRNDRETFFNGYVLSYVANDYEFIKRMMAKEPVDKMEKYQLYLETLKTMKESFLQSVSYEVIAEEGDIESVKIKCNFPYIQNEISTKERMPLTEIFIRNIRSNYFLSDDMPRVLQGNPQVEIDFMVEIYKHIADFLSEARTTLKVDGEMVEEKTPDSVIYTTE